MFSKNSRARRLEIVLREMKKCTILCMLIRGHKMCNYWSLAIISISRYIDGIADIDHITWPYWPYHIIRHIVSHVPCDRDIFRALNNFKTTHAALVQRCNMITTARIQLCNELYKSKACISRWISRISSLVGAAYHMQCRSSATANYNVQRKKFPRSMNTK